jgi:hypothetical protein
LHSATPQAGAANDGAQDRSKEGRAPLADDDIDRIVAALERRVLAELERRGRRHRPGVF